MRIRSNLWPSNIRVEHKIRIANGETKKKLITNVNTVEQRRERQKKTKKKHQQQHENGQTFIYRWQFIETFSENVATTTTTTTITMHHIRPNSRT